MASLDGLEDEDDTFYYEVEEIVQMYTTDSGVRMFEIKWKNYGPEHNTWEPEHNLNCPSVLKAFFEKMGINPNGGRKKSVKKKKSVTSVDEPNHVTESTSSTESSNLPKSKKSSSEKRKEKKDTFIVSDDDIEIWDQSNKGKKKKDSKKRKEKDAETESFLDDDYAYEPDTIEESDVWNQFDTEILKKKDASTKKNDEKDTTKKRKLSDIRRERKYDEAINRGKMALETAKRIIEQEKRSSDAQSSSSSNGSEPTKQTEASFTAIKRSLSHKPTAIPTVDIDQLIDSVKRAKPLALSKYPESRPPPPKKITLTYNNYPNNLALNTTPSPPLPAPQLSRSTAQHSRPLLSQSRPSHSQQQQSRPSRPPPPPPSPPPQQPSPVHIPTHHGNKNHLASTSGQVERLDPRIRAREDQLTDTSTSNVSLSTRTRKDPRRTADNVDRIKLSNSTAFPTPFVMNTLLYSGTRFISPVLLEAHQNCYHEAQIRELISLTSNKQNEIRANYTVPLKALNNILLGRSISFMTISPKDKFIELSKLKSYYQVNEMSGVVHHPDSRLALMLVAEEDIKKLSNLPSDIGVIKGAYTKLFGVFVDGLIPRPKALSNEIVYDTDCMDTTTPYQWNFVIDYLKFPEQLRQLTTKSKFVVYGSSDASAVLGKAINHLKHVQSPPTSYVMMFDRYNDTYFSRNLTKHKKETATQIWEYGVPDYSYAEILPASEIFPNHSGGFVTTDMENIAHNPAIIGIINEEIARLNAIPTVYGEWKFILPHNWLQLLKNTIKDQASGQRAKEAIVALAVALSNDSIHILRLWSDDSEELNHLQYLNRIAHNKYKTYQYFVYVDDISSVHSSQHIFSIDFVKSDRIYSTFA
ncbi:hypothetical protein BDF21DRAFT_466708 [Thamnidium elegans]|nr:hypothetical protein BDF21DRAFT_466708 [Thamnidium elegans]